MLLFNDELGQLHNQVLLPRHLKYLLLCVDVAESPIPGAHISFQPLVISELKSLGLCFCLDCLLDHLQGINILDLVVCTLDALIESGPRCHRLASQFSLDGIYLGNGVIFH